MLKKRLKSYSLRRREESRAPCGRLDIATASWRASYCRARRLLIQPLRIVTKADIIERIASGTGLTKIETEAVVNGFIATVIKALTQGEGVELRGFGSFRAQHRAARTARNPRTKEIVEIEARYVPVFKASKDFRDAVDEAMKQKREP